MMEAVVAHIICDGIGLVPDREEDDPGWTGNWQDGNKRRSEDNDSWNRSDNQKGRQDEDNRERHVFVGFQYRK